VSTTAQFDVKTFLRTLTHAPGVYRMVDRDARVIYVGKARDLKRRVSSYFRAPSQLSEKTRALMARAAAVEITATHTETEALLLENTLIKRHQPHYNVLLRDGKGYPYIHLSAARFPRLSFYRGARREAGRYFGPFANAGAVRETLAMLQRLFRLRQCDTSFFNNRSRACLQHQIDRCSAPCVGLIDEAEYAASVRHAVLFLEGRSKEMVDELVVRMKDAANLRNYESAARCRDQIVALRRVQERQHVVGGRGDVDVIAAVSRDTVAVVALHMIRNGHSLGTRTVTPRHTGGADPAEILTAFVSQYYFDDTRTVAYPREIVASEALTDSGLLGEALSTRAEHKITLRHRVRGERAHWLAAAIRNAELELDQRLASRAGVRTRLTALRDALGLDEAPGRIECFDVSHSAGEATVASCVVFGPEGAIKSDYRRFNISGVAPGDDYAATHQALERRYTRLRREQAKLPDLILIDGGRGQLAEARAVLRELQIDDVCLAGVAKGATRKPGLEKIFLADRNEALALPNIRLRCTSSSKFATKRIASRSPDTAPAGRARARARCSNRSPESAHGGGNDYSANSVDYKASPAPGWRICGA